MLNKVSDHFKNKISTKGVLFLQEAYSCGELQAKWNDKRKGQIYFHIVKLIDKFYLQHFLAYSVNEKFPKYV